MTLNKVQIVKILISLAVLTPSLEGELWAGQLPADLRNQLQNAIDSENSKIYSLSPTQQKTHLNQLLSPIINQYFTLQPSTHWQHDREIVAEIDNLIESSVTSNTADSILPPLSPEIRKAWLASQFQLLGSYVDKLENHAEALTLFRQDKEAKVINAQAQYVLHNLTVLYKTLQADRPVSEAEHETAINFYVDQSRLPSPIDQPERLVLAACHHFRELSFNRQLALKNTPLGRAIFNSPP